MVVFSMSLLDKDKGSCWKRLTDIHGTDHLVRLIISIFWYCPLGSIYKGLQFIFTLCAHSEKFTYKCLPWLLIGDFPIVLLTSFQPSPPTSLATANESVKIYTSECILLPVYKNRSVLRVMPTKTVFHSWPSEWYMSRAMVLQLWIFSWCWHVVQKHLWTRVKYFPPQSTGDKQVHLIS